MITAEQAREIKENATKTRIKLETDVWQHLIRQASLAEKDHVSVEFEIDKDTLKELKAAGFKLYSNRDFVESMEIEDGNIITW